MERGAGSKGLASRSAEGVSEISQFQSLAMRIA